MQSKDKIPPASYVLLHLQALSELLIPFITHKYIWRGYIQQRDSLQCQHGKEEALISVTRWAPCHHSSKNPLVHDILTASAFVQKSSGLITALSLSLFTSFLLQVKHYK